MNELELRRLIRTEVSRLKDGHPGPEEIADSEPLFSVPGEVDSRIDLDSLDALELGFAIEQATGIDQPPEFDYHELLSVDAIVEFLATHATVLEAAR